MKKPKVTNLSFALKETKRIRSALDRRKSVKITINIDMDSLKELRRISTDSGIPYQRLLNQVLREGLGARTKTESRLDRLERELERMKKQFAA